MNVEIAKDETDVINGVRGALILLVVIGHFLQYIALCLPEGMTLFANGIVLLIYFPYATICCDFWLFVYKSRKVKQ